MIKWITVLLLFPAMANATNYYISNSGNDSNKGTSAADAWQSIAKLNTSFSAIHAGDTIFFKRGDLFYGSIVITQPGAAGKPVVFTAYGQGANPIISGFTTIGGWTKKEGGVWQAPAPGVKRNLNMLTLNGIPQRIGRYPNADETDGGYLRYENFTGSTSITDNELKDDINWTGAEVVIRKDHWTAERCRVISKEGGKINFTFAREGINAAGALPPMHPATKGNGYFFQNDSRTLDELGEWFFDTTNRNLQLFFGAKGPSGNLIKASTIDTLINAGNMSFITISRLSFEGANMSAIYCRAGSDITIQYCDFNNIGAKAIHIWNTPNVLIDHINTSYILCNAIQVRNGKQDNVTVTNCVIKNTAPFIGMGSFFDGRDYKGISASAYHNLLIANNIVDTVGFCGIEFQGNNAMIKNNFVNYFCYLLDDGGGIYTWVDYNKNNKDSVMFINRVIKDNIVLHGMGATEGCFKSPKAEGIYLDGKAMNTQVLNNTVAFTGNRGIEMNAPLNITVRNNTFFNTGGGWVASRLYSWENIRNVEMKNNIFYSMDDKQKQGEFYHSGLDMPEPVSSIWEAVRLMGDIDSNYYNTLNPVGFEYYYAPIAGKSNFFPSPLSLENWKALSQQDEHSKRPAVIIPLYVLKKITGPDLISNGGFDNNMDAVQVFGSNMTGGRDNTGKLTGNGSVKMEFSKPETSRYGVINSSVGKVSAGKKYIFRFKTLGTTECGIVRAYLRRTAAPYNDLVPQQTQVFGTSIQQHEFLFVADASTEANYVIAVEKNSGTTYIDDVELYEADATPVNSKDYVRFEYNATGKAVTVSLDKKYVGVDGSIYKGSLTQPPFSSKILISAVVQ
jgi:parallel beta-helix repeat protein